jgi:hypothetical protein
MRTQTEKKARKVRVLRAKRLPKKTYADECRELQESIGRGRNWELMPDSSEIIREMRDGEDH